MRGIYDKLSVFYDKRGAVCFGFAALVLMLFILFSGRTIGLSNNGDFQRIMDASSLQFDAPDGAFAFDSTYTITLTEPSAAGNISKILFGAEGFSNYPSLQIPVVRVSVVLNLIVNKLTGSDMSVYRIEILGLIHCVLYAAVLAFLFMQFSLKKRAFDILAKALTLIVLCDVGYLTYFNSFYGEGLQLIAFTFLAAMLVRLVLTLPRLADAFLSALGCIVFGWSKFFNIPAACVFAVLLFGIMLYKTKRKTHAAIGIVTLLALVAIYLSIPSWMGYQTKFNAIFFGALKDAEPSACEQYLNELDLPPEFIEFRNTNYYVEGIAAALEKSGGEKNLLAVSNLDIATFYLRHPDRLMNLMSLSLLNSDSIRPFYLSNFSNDDAPKLTLSHRFSFWSDTRAALGFDTWPGFIGVILVFSVTVFILMLKSGRKWYEPLFVLLLLMGILVYFFIVPFISNGEGDLAKHLFASASLLDLMVLFVLTAALHELSGRKVRLASAGCLVMVLCLAYTPVKSELLHVLRRNNPHNKLETGAYLAYGAYSDNPLVWQVAALDGGSATLLCADAIAGAPYAANGSNAWEASSLRQWLNTAFLSAFSERERAGLLLMENPVLLMRDTKGTASSGSRDFYFSPVPLLASRGYEDAYQTVVLDTVTLPDIDLIARLAEENTSITLEEAYWLETPYFNNSYMTRCVMPDGSILMRESDAHAGVRPVIDITASTIASGTGTYADPFVLN